MKNTADSVSEQIEKTQEEIKLLKLQEELLERRSRPQQYISRSDTPLIESPVKYGEWKDVRDEDRGEIEGVIGIIDRSELLLCELPTPTLDRIDDQVGRNDNQDRKPAQLDDHDLVMANRKLSDSSKYPHMSAREAAAALGISVKAVYEHGGLEEIPTGTRRRVWSTKSVIAIKNSPPK